jgi:hypothetical protein
MMAHDINRNMFSRSKTSVVRTFRKKSLTKRKTNTIFHRIEYFHDFFFTKNKNLIQSMYTIGLVYLSSINVTIKQRIHSK